MLTNALILTGKLITYLSRVTKKGNGSTWPGHIALSVDKTFIRNVLKNSHIKIVLIVGTNGKTTTGKMLTTILERAGNNVFQNTSGANLLNGIASTIITHASIHGKLPEGYAVFETDEFNLPLLLEEVIPDAIIVLNLFRDQLDRYGELDTIAKKWHESFLKLPRATTLILNADDPLIASLDDSLKAKVIYYGLNEKTAYTSLQHAADSLYCPRCGAKLIYDRIFYSHIGIWHCPKCGLKRPKPEITSFFFPLHGAYNKYNTLAAVSYAQLQGIEKQDIEDALKTVKPAFGRQEMLDYNGKKVQIFLSKNPAGYNESLRTIKELGARTVLFLLNDRIPDGRDVSWIWDVDFEEFTHGFDHIFVSGDRVYDLALRLQYAIENKKSNMKNQKYKEKIQHYESLKEAIDRATEGIDKSETLYILPTYSAMLETRKIITGREIL